MVKYRIVFEPARTKPLFGESSEVWRKQVFLGAKASALPRGFCPASERRKTSGDLATGMAVLRD
jgi:hypothetical protein